MLVSILARDMHTALLLQNRVLSIMPGEAINTKAPLLAVFGLVCSEEQWSVVLYQMMD